MSIALLFLVLTCSAFSFAAEKPSPFVARTSAPAAPAAAPVSPVAPALSILRATRPKPFVASGGVPSSVSPLTRPASVAPGELKTGALKALREVSPPPLVEKVAPLKTTVLEVPVPTMVVASIRPPQVSEIEKGMAKALVVSKLGSPSTVISMYEDSRFLESLRYEWQGRWQGTVRLVNGQVSRVDQP